MQTIVDESHLPVLPLYDLHLPAVRSVRESVAVDEEVWFGFVLRGWWAKATEPLHWLIYGAGAYGFWKMTRWMWPWAGVYAAQVSLSMLVWNLVDERGAGWLAGIAAAAVFMLPAIALWRARPRFASSRRRGLRHENQSAAPHRRRGRGEPRRTRRHIRTNGHDDRATSFRRRRQSPRRWAGGSRDRIRFARPRAHGWHSGISSI